MHLCGNKNHLFAFLFYVSSVQASRPIHLHSVAVINSFIPWADTNFWHSLFSRMRVHCNVGSGVKDDCPCQEACAVATYSSSPNQYSFVRKIGISFHNRLSFLLDGRAHTRSWRSTGHIYSDKSRKMSHFRQNFPFH